MNFYKTLVAVFFICFGIRSNMHAQTDSAGNRPPANYSSNILSVIPFQFTENGIGLGFSYERAIDKKGLFAFYIPCIATFDIANSNRIYDYNTGNYNTGHADAMCYTMPGIKFYPTGRFGKIKYATGASLVIGSGKKSSDLTDLNGLNVTEQIQPHFLSGYMWQNSLNVNMDKRLCIGAEAGIGETFINRVGGISVSNEFLVQGALKVGFRF